MSTVSILSILVYPQSGYLLVYHMGLSLVHCSYRSIGSLHILAIKGSIIYIEASHLTNFSIHLMTILCTGCSQSNMYFEVRGMDNGVWVQTFVSD